VSASDDLRVYLSRHGLATSASTRITPLQGGVSSDIWLVEEQGSRFVVKRARPRLDVPDEWLADVSRNHFEQEFLAYVGAFLPGAVPRILHADPEHGLFAMEHLAGHVTWKSLLLQGIASPAHADQASRLLATIHRHSWNDPDARRRFDSLGNFQQLRIEPYLHTTGQRHPALQALFDEEARRLAATSLCLVHGDFSPKNIMIAPSVPSSSGADHVVLLDCEVAWYGDPAFDIAFLLNHFLLKALLFRTSPGPFLELALRAWQTYQAEAEPVMRAGLKVRVARLLVMLMLARIDGKSPVEYLQDQADRQVVRAFATRCLLAQTWSVPDLIKAWRDSIASRRQDG
jgi:aminoglycoside phosphotransferase (APT) family kinase protein